MSLAKSKRFWLLLVCFTAVLAAVAGVYWWREPSYQDRTLTAWLQQYVQSIPRDLHELDAQAAARIKASETAVRALCPRALPHLLDLALAKDDKFTPLRSRFADWQHREYLRAYERRSLGMAGFYILGADAREIVPTVIRRFDEDPYFATLVLKGIGPDAVTAVPFLLSRLPGGNTDLRTVILECLPAIQPDAAVVLPILVQHTNDPDQHVRLAAARELHLLEEKLKDENRYPHRPRGL